MRVKLVAYTQPTEDFVNELGREPDLMEMVAYFARVSNPDNQHNHDTSRQLINYLVRNKHWSPFEMVSATMEIVTTRDIARQILRHRSFSFQEFSQRYADPTKDLEFEVREARLQDTKNRQNSIEIDQMSPSQRGVAEVFRMNQIRLVKEIKDMYAWAVHNGIAKEQARVILPEGLTQSRLYMSGTLRSWIHYIDLRSEKGTQKEHREIAIACAEALSPVFTVFNPL